MSSRRPSKFTQADVQRAVRAAKAEGLPIEAIHILPDGAIWIITDARESVPHRKPNPFDK